MKSLKSLILTGVTVLSTSAALATPREGIDAFPKTPSCRRAKSAILADSRQSQFNALGVTSWLNKDICALEVTFEESSKLLAFVDARIAAGLPPTMEVVKGVNGHKVGVKLILQVIGRIVPEGSGGAGEAADQPVPATQEELMVLQEAFVKAYMFNPALKITGVGITIAMFQPALSVGFETPAAMRRYIVLAIGAGEFPGTISGHVNAKLVSAPVLLEIMGPAFPEPVGSISN